MKNWCVLLVFLFFSAFSFTQSPYETNWKKELPYIITGGATLGAGAYLSTIPPLITPNELTTLDPNDVNRFDRIAIDLFSENADRASDIFWLGSHLTPMLFLTGDETRENFGQIMTLYGEVAAINAGLTSIIKSATQRPRPFVFNPDVSENLKFARNAKTSFLSGHTSMTAANTFFVAKVFSDFYPESKWKAFIWGTAATIPAITGYLRVKAGKHYPSDVIAGYALGAAVGILVPQWHKNKKLREKGISLNVGYNSARLTWNFK